MLSLWRQHLTDLSTYFQCALFISSSPSLHQMAFDVTLCSVFSVMNRKISQKFHYSEWKWQLIRQNLHRKEFWILVRYPLVETTLK